MDTGPYRVWWISLLLILCANDCTASTPVMVSTKLERRGDDANCSNTSLIDPKPRITCINSTYFNLEFSPGTGDSNYDYLIQSVGKKQLDVNRTPPKGAFWRCFTIKKGHLIVPYHENIVLLKITPHHVRGCESTDDFKDAFCTYAINLTLCANYSPTPAPILSSVLTKSPSRPTVDDTILAAVLSTSSVIFTAVIVVAILIVILVYRNRRDRNKEPRKKRVVIIAPTREKSVKMKSWITRLAPGEFEFLKLDGFLRLRLWLGLSPRDVVYIVLKRCCPQEENKWWHVFNLVAELQCSDEDKHHKLYENDIDSLYAITGNVIVIHIVRRENGHVGGAREISDLNNRMEDRIDSLTSYPVYIIEYNNDQDMQIVLEKTREISVRRDRSQSQGSLDEVDDGEAEQPLNQRMNDVQPFEQVV